MTEAKPTAGGESADRTPVNESADTDSLLGVAPGAAEAYGRILLFGGMGWLAIGSFVGMAVVFWGGVGIVALAFACNTAAKLLHYRGLDAPRNSRVKLAASWLLLAASVLGLLGTYAYGRYGPGDGGFFWSFALAGVGFGLLHMAAQARYLPGDADAT